MMSCCTIRWHDVCCHSFLAGMFGASEAACRWESSLCLFSPTWWFRLVRVPKDCQVQSPWWCQIFPRRPDCPLPSPTEPGLSFALNSLAKSRQQTRISNTVEVHSVVRCGFVMPIQCLWLHAPHRKVCNCNICLLLSISFYQPVCVSLVIHDTYTFFTHAAGRIPGKHFNFDLLTSKLCFPPLSACLSAVSTSFPNCSLHPFPSLSLLASLSG